MSDKRLKLTPGERQKLKELYNEKKFNQEELADQAGISLDTLKQMLGTKGDKDLVNKWDIEKVAEALGCHPTEFMNPERWNIEKSKYTGRFQGLIEEKIRKFVGREFVFKAFEKFIKTHDRGYFTVVGDPGEGKSTVAAKYVNDHPSCLYYFNVYTDSQNRADQFLECICQQLICEYGLEDYQPNSLPQEAKEDGNFLKNLLQKVSDKLKPHEKKVVIVIDALDEVNMSHQQNGFNILYLPRYLPKSVYFLLTRRRELETRLLFETPQEIFDFKDYTMNSREDIKKYIYLFFEDEFKNSLYEWIGNQNLNKKEFIDTLAEKSENNFMYLRYVLPEIAKGYYQNLQLENLPQGLTSYYEDHWRRMGMQDKPLPKLKIKIVYILGVLRKPVSRQLIAKFVSVKDEIIVQEVLNEWSQFLHYSQIQGQTRYKVYHASFADFLSRKEMIEAAGIEITEIHGSITNALLEDLDTTEDED
ncbi:AAA family ATPase [Limnoraphis robusta Tam1]|uniref:AAA family ATPase n=1 Tax=Limnoraphis robusta CCNP1315 TaxID=3110306 RepID=A0ABU5TVJ8_9CYAN|nr:AAA family ATPase [Limnoraphis robusta]MEA5499854.1 AAA family ATPase [Limnoraphis robusta BA-68 BA1]MEA5518568.1 AAA family ATPase [Limnoraphis robusta CCNP1315]MEA5538702.1 AAA family ATPase [Limnoraphis robusta Tam1]MEA5548037.1 AAA family ATPase [Limnoraphis robusta CCNP1324]